MEAREVDLIRVLAIQDDDASLNLIIILGPIAFSLCFLTTFCKPSIVIAKPPREHYGISLLCGPLLLLFFWRGGCWLSGGCALDGE